MIREYNEVVAKIIAFGILEDEEEEFISKKFAVYVEQSHTPRTDYMKFIDEFNKQTGKQYPADAESRALFYENEAMQSLDKRIRALRNAITNPWFHGKGQYQLTPQFILEKYAEYINYTYTPPASAENEGGNIQEEPVREYGNF